MEKPSQSSPDKVKRALDLVLAQQPIDINTVDQTLHRPEFLAQEYGETFQYFNEIENRVEQNANQLHALLPYMDADTRAFIAAWEEQELVHGEIFDQALQGIGMAPYAFDPNEVSRGFHLGGELSRIPSADTVLQFLYFTTGALHERLTAKGYIGLINNLKSDGEFEFAETGVKQINAQEGKHLGYYKEAALQLRDQLTPWQLTLAREIKVRTYAPVGAFDNDHKVRFAGVLETVSGAQTTEELAAPVQKIAEQLLIDPSKRFVVPKLGAGAVNGASPVVEIAQSMLDKTTRGLELPQFVLKSLNDCIDRRREEIVPEDEGFAVPVQ